jgi:hypothetical protein
LTAVVVDFLQREKRALTKEELTEKWMRKSQENWEKMTPEQRVWDYDADMYDEDGLPIRSSIRQRSSPSCDGRTGMMSIFDALPPRTDPRFRHQLFWKHELSRNDPVLPTPNKMWSTWSKIMVTRSCPSPPPNKRWPPTLTAPLATAAGIQPSSTLAIAFPMPWRRKGTSLCFSRAKSLGRPI